MAAQAPHAHLHPHQLKSSSHLGTNCKSLTPIRSLYWPPANHELDRHDIKELGRWTSWGWGSALCPGCTPAGRWPSTDISYIPAVMEILMPPFSSQEHPGSAASLCHAGRLAAHGTHCPAASSHPPLPPFRPSTTVAFHPTLVPSLYGPACLQDVTHYSYSSGLGAVQTLTPSFTIVLQSK